jgi:ATP-dependent helicase HrpB
MNLPRFPVHEVVPDVRDSLEKNNILILQAPPGAGKSTILPLELMHESWLSGKKIILLEPRRIAARAVATRMAELLNEQPGETVGYRVRFEKKISARTKIEVVTEGILTRMLQRDNALEDYSLVVFDEFHERSIHTDVSLALCLQVQNILRPELKILVMSATLQAQRLSALLNDAPVITSMGRQFPVGVFYSKQNSDEPVPVQAAKAVHKAFNEQNGDLLVFLPGAGEIIRAKEILEEMQLNAKIFPLYGDLNYAQQQEAILPDKSGRRKIILSTSIAETSLTIEGVETVVDAGYSRGPKFDPASGLTRLQTYRVTKDTADQRAGRAGRLGPGVCYRLWTEATHFQLEEQRKPEILEADLAAMMLELYSWGVSDINDLSWVTLPPAANVARAMELLEYLEAVKEGKITTTGKEMLEFPTHPRIAHLFLKAKTWDQENKSEVFRQTAADLAALIEERDPLDKTAGVDIHLRMEQLVHLRKKEFVRADKRTLERVEQLSRTWRNMLGVKEIFAYAEDYTAGKLIAEAYPERVAMKLAGTAGGKFALYRLANGTIARLPENDTLMAEQWIAIALMDAGAKEGKIFLAAALNPENLKERIVRRTKIEWDERTGTIHAREEKSIGIIALESKVIEKISQEERISILCDAIRKEGLRSFGWNEQCENWRARVMSMRTWNSQEEWPELTMEKLGDSVGEWLSPYLTHAKTREQIQKLNWNDIVNTILPWELQERLNKLAPEKITVPSDSVIRLNYFPNGKSPELHVRLQEVFGMKETPTVNNGKIKIVLHLLSPGYKPVQVTQDLHSFWNSAYHEVRKELKQRYPRHSWPENPLEAAAVRGPKKRT